MLLTCCNKLVEPIVIMGKVGVCPNKPIVGRLLHPIRDSVCFARTSSWFPSNEDFDTVRWVLSRHWVFWCVADYE
jgi:hypothetical protein